MTLTTHLLPEIRDIVAGYVIDEDMIVEILTNYRSNHPMRGLLRFARCEVFSHEASMVVLKTLARLPCSSAVRLTEIKSVLPFCPKISVFRGDAAVPQSLMCAYYDVSGTWIFDVTDPKGWLDDPSAPYLLCYKRALVLRELKQVLKKRSKTFTLLK